jgi:superfamily II DNA/RNA helicase
VHRIGRTGRAGRAGTAISIVTSLDSKSLGAIERLIGKSIPPAEGDYAVASASEEEADRPRQSRSREGSRGGRKPRREREPRAAGGSDKSSDREPRAARSGEREPRHAKGTGRNGGQQPHAASSEAFTPPAPPQPSRVPSIGRPEPRRSHREVDSEPADHSHLPAFLLRPVRARV